MTTQGRNLYNHSDPGTALHLSQNAPAILAKSSLKPSSIFTSMLGAAEMPEEWSELEHTFYACLRAKDDESAHQCLDRLSTRFGKTNERVVAMWGLYKEAVAKTDEDLRKVLQEYNEVLEGNPMNVPVHKRRIALIRSIGKPVEAIASLVQFLESFPTDTEAWCELSDLYQSQGLSAQAIYCLEEALLTVPNAWNLQARLGELNFLASLAAADGTEASTKFAFEAIHRFSRSIELCDDYLRGYYGLKLATDKVLQTKISGRTEDSIPESTVQKLSDLSIRKLKAIVQEWSTKKSGKLNESEVIAAQALLDGKS